MLSAWSNTKYRLTNYLDSSTNIRDFSWALSVIILWRLLLSVLGVVFLRDYLPNPPWVGEPIYETHWVTAPNWNPAISTFVNSWFRWDTGWYLKIAAYGYSPDDGSIIFPPLYPFLIRIFAPLVGGHYLLSALCISSLFALLTILLLLRLVRLDSNEHTARRAALYLIAFPSGFFLLAGYSESLFLALTLLAWLMARQGRWFLSGLAATLSTLARLQGWLIVLPLAWMVLSPKTLHENLTPSQQVFQTFRLFRYKSYWQTVLMRVKQGAWVTLFLPPLAFLSFQTWLDLTGLGSISSAYLHVWKMSIVPPWEGLSSIVQRLFSSQLMFIDWVDLILFVTFVVLSFASLRHLEPAYSLYIWSTLGLILMRGYSAHLMAGFMRYMLTLFPVFILLAKFGGKRTFHFTLLILFVPLQIFLLWLFLHWIWVA